MAWVVVGYYTEGRYAEIAKKLISSLHEFSIPHEVESVKDLGSWDANTRYKPTFIKRMMDRYPNRSIVYVDVDAVFYKYPYLFDVLDADSSVDVAVHILDHRKYRKRKVSKPSELLSGTIFLRVCDKTRKIVDEWERICINNPGLWDQVALDKVLRGKNRKFYNLPVEYCMIFDYDYGIDIRDPVIKHFQASREERKSVRRNV